MLLKLKEILMKTDDEADIENIIDDIKIQNISISAYFKEESKNPVDIYLELLENIVRPEVNSTSPINTAESDPVKSDSSIKLDEEDEQQDAFIGNIDYSADNDYYEDHSDIPLNFNPNDLLLGDSFEYEGNINLMTTNDKVDQAGEVVQPHSSEKFNSAFPELYKDLAIFKAPPKKSRMNDIEIRVKKRAHTEDGTVLIAAKDKITTSTTAQPEIATEAEVNENFQAFISDLEIFNYPIFMNEPIDKLDKKYLVDTSTGSLYGAFKSASKGICYLFLKVHMYS